MKPRSHTKRHTKARPAFQRAFLAWLEDVEPRLRIPLVFERRTDDLIEFTFAHTPCLTVTIDSRGNAQNIAVQARLADMYWDFVFDDDAEPLKTPEGFVCARCKTEKRRVFPSREALWRDHLFETFLEWINETLAPADVLLLHGIPEKTAWGARHFLADAPNYPSWRDEAAVLVNLPLSRLLRGNSDIPPVRLLEPVSDGSAR